LQNRASSAEGSNDFKVVAIRKASSAVEQHTAFLAHSPSGTLGTSTHSKRLSSVKAFGPKKALCAAVLRTNYYFLQNQFLREHIIARTECAEDSTSHLDGVYGLGQKMKWA
jgi:hypothetical protein